ncbi:ATP-binding protein [Cryobacterium tepidiphilum]|uniref:ATP-binding protein n=2 Tax=Cryobacterium tepidiphilum TaxID=2486026 RepID=A0A3M8L171_9MICO|nr:ATP-binding protein [Cryobacterium tepidiphilum]
MEMRTADTASVLGQWPDGGERDKLHTMPPVSSGGAAADALRRPAHAINPTSRRQIEIVLSRSVGGIGFIFALQTLPAMASQLDDLKPGWGPFLAITLYSSVALVVVCTVIQVGIRVACTIVSAGYLAALLAWPALLMVPDAVLQDKPWLWYFCSIATSCAALAFPLRWAAVYAITAPVAYGVLRLTPAGGHADLLLAALDAVYAILLGQVVLIIIVMLRQATAAVDIAQSNALRKYAAAVRHHATELERVEVDSIVHDSVLTTLLAAARAETPKEAELAVTMAARAMARLTDAGVPVANDETVIPFARVSQRIRHAAEAFASPFVVVEKNVDMITVPLQASDALYSATVQAMVNSMQHAGTGDITRTLTLRSNSRGGCTIEITDTGVGFDARAVPSERLGLRLSIMERMESAGGAVKLRTAPGEGTTVTIVWPRPAESGPDTGVIGPAHPGADDPATGVDR